MKQCLRLFEGSLTVNMSDISKAKPHVSKVQTQLKYEQTKLDLSKLNINQSDEVKDNKYAKPSEDIKPKQDAEDYKPIKSLATVVVSDVPAVVTLPDIRRVADTDGVTKIVIDLETSSRGRLILKRITILHANKRFVYMLNIRLYL